LVGALTWGTSFRGMFRSLVSLRELDTGVTVLDACCGAGLAVRWLDRSAVRRYIGVDISSAMLERAQSVAERRGFGNAEFHLADVEAMPLPDAGADIALLYNALHAVSDPQAAATEVARCVRPHGWLIGTMVVRGRGRRADRIIERESTKERGLMGPGGTSPDLEEWLGKAGFTDVELSFDGTLAVFNARRSESKPGADGDGRGGGIAGPVAWLGPEETDAASRGGCARSCVAPERQPRPYAPEEAVRPQVQELAQALGL
jgi:SAM-dependent methyltransferase